MLLSIEPMTSGILASCLNHYATSVNTKVKLLQAIQLQCYLPADVVRLALDPPRPRPRP